MAAWEAMRLTDEREADLTGSADDPAELAETEA
jgi:hypothetical protein